MKTLAYLAWFAGAAALASGQQDQTAPELRATYPKASSAPNSPSLGSNGSFVTSDHVKLHYLDAGRGRPIVFVPGWTMPAEIWEHQVRELSKEHRTIAFDPRSQGRSDIAAEGHFHTRRATDIHELLAHLELAESTIVGWSMGVPEILTYIRLFGTRRLSAVVLVDGLIWIDGGARWLGIVKDMQTDRRKFADRFVRNMYKQPQAEEYLQRIVDAHLRTPTEVASTLITNWAVGPETDCRPVLEKIDKPILFATTAGALMQTQAALLKEKVPSARVEVFDSMGHALFVDAPHRFNAALREFLRQP